MQHSILFIPTSQALSFMHSPLEIAFNGMDRSEFIERFIRKHLTRVERHFHQLTSCYVSVSAPHNSHRQGNKFEIHIKAHVPGTVLAVSHSLGDDSTHDDIQVLIRNSFNAFEAQLRKLKTKKHHRLRTCVREKYQHNDNILE